MHAGAVVCCNVVPMHRIPVSAINGTQIALQATRRGTPLRRWPGDLIANARMLSPARKALLVAAGAGMLCLAAWLVVAHVRGGRSEAAGSVAGDVAAGIPADDLEREARLERELAVRAESLLARTTGEGRVAVRVRAELDRSQREETHEAFDPEGQVERSEERTSEPAARGAAASVGRTTARVEYDVSKRITRAVTPAGAVKRLSVAVLVDGRPAADGVPKTGFMPWSAPELAQLEALAKQAVGFSSERGDELTLTNAPFREAAPGAFDRKIFVLAADALSYAALLAGLGVLGFVALRSLGGAQGMLRLPMSAAELEAELLQSGGLAAGMAALPPAARAEEIARAVDPVLGRDAGAAALRAWLNEE